MRKISGLAQCVWCDLFSFDSVNFPFLPFFLNTLWVAKLRILTHFHTQSHISRIQRRHLQAEHNLPRDWAPEESQRDFAQTPHLLPGTLSAWRLWWTGSAGERGQTPHATPWSLISNWPTSSLPLPHWVRVRAYLVPCTELEINKGSCHNVDCGLQWSNLIWIKGGKLSFSHFKWHRQKGGSPESCSDRWGPALGEKNDLGCSPWKI